MLRNQSEHLGHVSQDAGWRHNASTASLMWPGSDGHAWMILPIRATSCSSLSAECSHSAAKHWAHLPNPLSPLLVTSPDYRVRFPPRQCNRSQPATNPQRMLHTGDRGPEPRRPRRPARPRRAGPRDSRRPANRPGAVLGDCGGAEGVGCRRHQRSGCKPRREKHVCEHGGTLPIFTL